MSGDLGGQSDQQSLAGPLQPPLPSRFFPSEILLQTRALAPPSLSPTPVAQQKTGHHTFVLFWNHQAFDALPSHASPPQPQPRGLWALSAELCTRTVPKPWGGSSPESGPPSLLPDQLLPAEMDRAAAPNLNPPA